MMISPKGNAVFVEVPKTGSTAASIFLARHGWAQNGSKLGTVPGTLSGRHGYLTRNAKQFLDEHGMHAVAVVRNPWDRMASAWRNDRRDWDLATFLTKARFMHGTLDIMATEQIDWTYGCIPLRYENLEAEWAAYATTPDVPEPPEPLLPPMPAGGIPRYNTPVRSDPIEWTDELIEMVAERFAMDIITFGYTGPTQ